MQESPRKTRLWQPMILAAMLAVGMVIGTQIDDELPEAPLWQTSRGTSDWSDLINTVHFIKSRYGDSLHTDSIVEQTIKFLVDHLDPHSYYLSGSEYQYFKEKLAGGYEGVGIEYLMLNDTVYLTWVHEDGPAGAAGLKQGDRILSIDDRAISGQGLGDKEIWQVWKETDQTLSIHYLPRSKAKVSEIVLQKQQIQLSSVPVAELFDGHIGYIKILRFGKGTYTSFMEGLEALVDQGAKDLIIDVRNNPGGSLQEVVKILDQLVLEKDQLLLYMEGANTKRTEHRSTGRVFFPLDELIVLINENSVSASEVLAGVLQDLGRAKVIGRQSFGKALVQEMYDLDDHAALNLSVGRYFLPRGRSIQRPYRDRQAYDGELQDRIRRGELFSLDSFDQQAHILGPSTDGISRPTREGIFPDIFVPANALAYSAHWKEIKPAFNLATFSWFDEMQLDTSDLKNIMSIDSTLDKKLFGYLPATATNQDQAKWSAFLKNEVRLRFLSYLDKDRAIIKYANSIDPILKKALEALRQNSGAQKD